ncbi:hypothetical protein BDN71DRAFT_1227428 [Pleurotus eryngii]|uniref:Uncharacterized protein n=1 Tax=Pleurotus eryngii TaxID=5323 RepID=A0A9P6DDP2_PLEER|nr:hypothetical protein BDN71DRAFT_1227428 [Pleurotus eryngii]
MYSLNSYVLRNERRTQHVAIHALIPCPLRSTATPLLVINRHLQPRGAATYSAPNNNAYAVTLSRRYVFPLQSVMGCLSLTFVSTWLWTYITSRFGISAAALEQYTAVALFFRRSGIVFG